MLEDVKAKVRAFFAWVYNWITVLAGLVVGALSAGFDAFNQIVGATDISPLLPPDRAIKIIAAVALLKGLHAFYKSRTEA